MRNTYLRELYEIAREDKNVLSLVSDNGLIVYDDFRRDMPEQYFNFGISEGHMVTAAAGMASCGKIPFAYTIGAFLAYRSYEFIRLDMCLQKLNVKLVGIGAGVTYGYLGPTHHTTEDLAVLRCIPNLTLLSPATPRETRALVRYAYETIGPVYLRIGNNLPKELYCEDMEVVPGKLSTLRKGEDIVILATGEILYQVMEAAERLSKKGIEAEVISVHTIKPFDEQGLLEVAKKYEHIYSVEEHSVSGGLGGLLAETLTANGCRNRLTRIGLDGCFAKGYGTPIQVLTANGLDAEGIYQKIINGLE
ncbi:MAG: transketolase family protein [Roseburia sp.]